jgi:TolB-like protein
MEQEPARVIYEFGDFRLDPQRQLLVNGEGSVVVLAPRAFELLAFLLEHHTQLLDRSTLLKRVWPRIIVEDNTLSQHLSAVRRALGDGQNGQRYIVTIPGRGYRFVADVRRRPTAELNAIGIRGEVGADVESAQKTTTTPSVAVLPFNNLSGAPEKEYFADGMAEELIHLLARVPGLKVPARTSSFAYKGKNVHVRDIARDLGVAAVLEGSVRSAGELIRVTAQLIDASSGYHFWSHSYEREFRDIFKLQDEIASAIVNSLCSQLNVVLPPLAKRPPPTGDTAAYQLYLQGLSIGHLATAQSLQRGIEMLQRATELDAQFAAAFAAMAIMSLNLSMWGLPDAIDQAERAAEAALALDSSSADAQCALSLVSARRGEWVRAESHQRAAQQLGHRSDMLNYYIAYLPACVGHIENTLRHLTEEYRAAPAVPVMPAILAAATLALPLSANAAQQAVDYADLAIELGMPASAGPVPVVKAYATLRLGWYDQVMQAAQVLASRLPPALADVGGANVVVGVHAALTGRMSRSDAVQALDALVRAAAPEKFGPELSVHVLVWYTMLGELDRAYGFVERVLHYALPRHTLGLFLPWIWLPELLPFRRDLRFLAIVERLRLVDYWKKFGPPDEFDLRGQMLVFR